MGARYLGVPATLEARGQYGWRSIKLSLNSGAPGFDAGLDSGVLGLDTELDSDTTRHPRLDDKIIATGLKPLSCGVITYEEWKLGERSMLLRALKYLERYEAEAGRLVLIGWGLIFDINQIIARAMMYGLLKELDILRRAYKVDLMQIILPFNGWYYLKSIEMAKLLGIEIPHRNVDIPRLYHEGRYDEIVEHLKADLVFVEELYLRLRGNWPWTMKDLRSRVLKLSSRWKGHSRWLPEPL